jgi:hypothetical protein
MKHAQADREKQQRRREERHVLIECSRSQISDHVVSRRHPDRFQTNPCLCAVRLLPLQSPRLLGDCDEVDYRPGPNCCQATFPDALPATVPDRNRRLSGQHGLECLRSERLLCATLKSQKPPLAIVSLIRPSHLGSRSMWSWIRPSKRWPSPPSREGQSCRHPSCVESRSCP